MTTRVYENSLRAERLCELIRSSPDVFSFSEVIILPIPTTRDGVSLNGDGAPLYDLVEDADEGTLIVGYGLPDWFSMLASSLGAILIDCAEDEEFLLENAELTATATLGIILESEKRVPRDIRFGIVGYGRIAKALLRDLLYHGSRVTVYTRRESVRLDLAEAGVGSEPFSIGANLSEIDILINTAPQTPPFLSEIPNDVRVIEVASGNNFEARAVERYPSLPARSFPISAAGAWYKSVLRMLKVATGGGYGR